MDEEEKRKMAKIINLKNFAENCPKLDEKDFLALGYDKKIIEESLKKEINFDELKKTYKKIIFVLKKYLDLQESYYSIIALWIIGTYLHEKFNTFPILFINASKGSGKSRLLQLIKNMSYNGKAVIDLKEAVLFRTAKNHTLCIDEFEGVNKKENSTLRTLLNACYKRGISVERMKKVILQGKEEFIAESFDVFCPVVMANIWGLEQVLADRCIIIILEKSANPKITKLIEDFENDPDISDVKRTLDQIQCSLCSVVSQKNNRGRWNSYITLTTYNTLTTLSTYNTETTLTTQLKPEEISFFDKINKIEIINGRDLELFFPLLEIANLISKDSNFFEDFLEIVKKYLEEKKTEEFAESTDIQLVDFISKKIEWRGSYIPVFDIFNEFKLVASQDPEGERWLNVHWLGRALKRTKLIIQKRRLGRGIEVMLDVDKAKIQTERFK